MKAYQPIVVEILQSAKPQSVLDTPSGEGWLRRMFADPAVAIDGIDLFEEKPEGYRCFLRHDLDEGLPDSLPQYDAIVSCEGLEHIANPGRFLVTARRQLNPGGSIVVTTPNTWYPGARLQYFLRGFFPSFPALVGRIERGTHMHIMPWSWPQLHLHMALAGFADVRLHPCLEDERTHAYEKALALQMKAYCRGRARKARTEEERSFWETCAAPGALYARRLVVSGRRAA